MKKLAALLCALALNQGPALAADLIRKGPQILPPPPPTPSWAGFHVGLNGGYTWADNPSIQISSVPLPPPPLVTPQGAVAWADRFAFGASGSIAGARSGGFIGGGQLGYDGLITPHILAGVEADFQGVLGATGSAFVSNATTQLHPTSRLDYLGTVRARLGYLLTSDFLLYATGGAAYGGASSSMSIFQPAQGVIGGVGTGAASSTRFGWTAGAGGEWMFWPNLSAKMEYLHYDIGSIGSSLIATSGGYDPRYLIGNPFDNDTMYPYAYLTAKTHTHYSGNIIRAGVNYHFNWNPPLLSKL
ncbi:outer membrane protein [Methylocystis sp. Sn-Cys]|uniref:outer membrane protein n=1 Tax=Methylocystis sp. Sn-Cys TaxID=1701263 RepID=UPI0019217E1E|nr:outer membrane beta-barrel protein [Methylocystis sp. Sn-Cys]MBL1255260.1 outer membrane beta-barrel protein [Methylocystis sp. Sn-Cys]